MEAEAVIYRQSGAVAEIRFNRPHRLNAVIEQLYDETLALLARAEADPGVRVVVITGEGRAFCVGADMKEHGTRSRTPFQRRAYLKRGQEVCKAIQRLSKVVVAAVNGYALGAGAEMAISADFLLMAQSARIGLPEVGIGTFIGGGVTKRLPQLVGLARARELIFLGERIDGAEAHRIGLASAVFADDRFRDEVSAYAGRLASRAPISMALAKEQINAASDRDLDAVLLAELEGVVYCTTTRDWQEGVDAFAEKRMPVFRGE